ncbi:MAG: methyltransferase domain-containing protein, partial [Spirochaetota bacterium]
MLKPEQAISRVTRSKEEARVNYNRISKWYDIISNPAERKCRKLGLQKLGVRQGEIILEIGFGTGHGIVALARSAGESGKVYGIDISEKMHCITQERVKKNGLSERVELKCGDAARLPYADNFFDAVFLSFTLELFDTPEIPVVLHECQRVLRSSGRICVT